MAVEVFGNNTTGTLNGGITSSATSLVCTTVTGTFPATGNFRIGVDSGSNYEIIEVTANSSGTFTIVRGGESTAVSHLTGVAITLILTAAGLSAGIVDPAQPSLSGTTAGTVISSMPHQQATFKEFLAFFNGYNNTTATAQTITFPTAFSQIPVFLANIDPPCTVTATTLTLPASLGGTVTGWVVLKGY